MKSVFCHPEPQRRISRSSMRDPSLRLRMTHHRGSTQAMPTSTHRVGVDIGGTFTDLIIFDDATGALTIGKTLTTPADPSQAIEAGLAETLARAELGLSQ